MSNSNRNTSTYPLDFNQIDSDCVQHALQVFDALGIDGKLQGTNFQLLNPGRQDVSLGSFSFNIKNGIWKDFADSSMSGKGFISLVAKLFKLSSYNAAKKLSDILHSFSLQVPLPQVTQRPVHSTSNITLEWATPHPQAVPDIKPELNRTGKPTAVYEYRDALGNVILYVARYDIAGKKTFRPFSLWREGNRLRWMSRLMPRPRPIYNLSNVLARQKDPVMIAEGEKSANAAQVLFPEMVTTTTLNGALGVEASDLSPLYGRDIYIWPDNDEPGREYAEKLKQILTTAQPPSRLSIMKTIDVFPEIDDMGKAMLKPGFYAPKGWDSADAIEMGWTADHMRLFSDFKSQPVQSSNVIRLDNYLVNDKGVFTIKTSNDGKELFVKIASRIDVVASTRDMSNQNWGMLVQFKDRDNFAHEMALPKELLSGSGENYRQELLNRGLDIMPGSSAKEALTGYLMEAKPEARAWCVDKMGWHKGVYVIESRNYPATSERTILQSENIQRSSAFGVSGSLEKWQEHIAKQCEGNSRLILTLCASLATPFIDLLGMENGGFHLRGQSSGGKTKALNVAGSVWGSPEMVKQWKSTANAMEAVALEHNDCILLLDELAQIEPDQAGTTAYGLANGTQKARANQKGGLRTMARWRMFFLSTGEISLAEHVAQANMAIKAGHEVRMLDIPADPGAGMGLFETIHEAKTPQIFADELKAMCEKYYGVAADALLKAITQSNDAKYEAIEFVKAVQKSFIADFVPEGSHGQVGRAAARFGMVAGVGEYCIKIGLLPWATGQAIWGINKCYQDWLLSRGGNRAGEELRAVQQVRSIIEQHGESRFTLLSPECHEDNIGQRTINRIGFRKILNDGATEYWVMPEMYKSVLCANFDPKVVTKVLLDRGILKPNKSGEHTWVKRYPGSGSNGGRVYIIHASIYEQPLGGKAINDHEMVEL